MFGLFETVRCKNCGFKCKKNGDVYVCPECGSYVLNVGTAIKSKNYTRENFPCEHKPADYQGIYLNDTLLDKDEYPIRIGPASMEKGMIMVGGSIYLTNKRFIFKGHKANLMFNEIFELPIKDLISVAIAGLGVTSDTISIMDKEYKNYKLSLYGGKEWFARMDELIKESKSQSAAQAEAVEPSGPKMPPPPPIG